MSKSYRPYEPDQIMLMPPSLREWLPSGHLAHFVSDVVESLDLSEITLVYEREERGFPPYHPVMMTKVLVYAPQAAGRWFPRGCCRMHRARPAAPETDGAQPWSLHLR